MSLANVESSPAAASGGDGHQVLAYVKSNGSIRYRISDSNGEFLGTSGWQPVGGTLAESKIPNGGVARNDEGRRIGVAVVARSASRFTVIAVRKNGHGNGELAMNSYDWGTWSGWTYRPVGDTSTTSISARPSAVLDGATMHLLANREGSNGSCAVVAMNLTVSGFPTVAQMNSYVLHSAGSPNCAAPPTVSAISGSAYHTFIINEDNHVLYRRSTDAYGDYKQIGGLPKEGTGVTAVQTQGSGEDTLILMNGIDVLKYYKDTSGDPVVQPGGLWFRRWGSID